MKAIIVLLGVLYLISFPLQSYGQSTMSKKEIKLMYDNNIGKFVRKAGSEENAIEKLMAFCLPDTFYNRDNKNMIWHTKKPVNLINIDYYSSRRMQALFWILKIYHTDYTTRNNKKEYCMFMNGAGETIWDYKDLDLDKKAYFYQVIIASPVQHKTYYGNLGYISVNSKFYHELERSFNSWYQTMKVEGLQYMRNNKIQPVNSSNYKTIVVPPREQR